MGQQNVDTCNLFCYDVGQCYPFSPCLQCRGGKQSNHITRSYSQRTKTIVLLSHRLSYLLHRQSPRLVIEVFIGFGSMPLSSVSPGVAHRSTSSVWPLEAVERNVSRSRYILNEIHLLQLLTRAQSSN